MRLSLLASKCDLGAAYSLPRRIIQETYRLYVTSVSEFSEYIRL